MSLAQNTTLCYLERDGAWLMLHRVKKNGLGWGANLKPARARKNACCGR